MQTKCPHCDKSIQPGAIVCPHCGSYVVKMDERKRRWHFFVIPLVGVAVVAGILYYMELKEREMIERRQAMLEAERPVDPSVQRQHEQDELERQRKEALRKQIQAEKERRLAERKLNEEWRAKPTKEKKDYLVTSLSELRARIKSLKASAAGDATGDFHTWLTNLETRIATADTFIDADQFNQARSLIEDAVKELDEVMGVQKPKEPGQAEEEEAEDDEGGAPVDEAEPDEEEGDEAEAALEEGEAAPAAEEAAAP